MSCAACGRAGHDFKVSLSPRLHEGLCATCGPAWTEYAQTTGVGRNRWGDIWKAFRRWCAARKETAA